MSQKLTQLTSLSLPLQNGDEIYIVRGANQFKVRPAALFQGFLKFVQGYEGYIIIPAAGNVDSTIVQTNDILIGKGAYFSGDYVMMRALQDTPTLDAHFKRGYSGEEES